MKPQSKSLKCPFRALNLIPLKMDPENEINYYKKLQGKFLGILKRCQLGPHLKIPETDIACELCKEFQQAYEILVDPQTRRYFYKTTTKKSIKVAWVQARKKKHQIDNAVLSILRNHGRNTLNLDHLNDIGEDKHDDLKSMDRNEERAINDVIQNMEVEEMPECSVGQKLAGRQKIWRPWE